MTGPFVICSPTFTYSGQAVASAFAETSAHEASEPAAQETAENNGTFHPGGHGPGGASNETSAHETGESAAQESAENARASATPKATP